MIFPLLKNFYFQFILSSVFDFLFLLSHYAS